MTDEAMETVQRTHKMKLPELLAKSQKRLGETK